MPIRVDNPDVTSRLRLRNHDYSSPGLYFVTLCVENRSCLFGEVHEGALESHPSGLMVESWWYTIPMRFPSTEVADVVVMPNHLHGLITLGTDPRQEKTPSLSRVVGWLKSITTTDYRRGVELFGWPRFFRQAVAGRVLRPRRAHGSRTASHRAIHRSQSRRLGRR